ncbi:MAG: phosphate ABC transporter permease PstA [Nitrospirae bacterium]|nr:phosphate ABC transporter permease PstA [Nitrospirota bacterium]
MADNVLPEKGLSLYRQVRNVLLGTLTAFAFVLAVTPLLAIIWVAYDRGKSALSLAFVTTMPSGFPVGIDGGILNGIVGSLILIIIASLLSVPVGIWAGLFLWDQSHTRLAKTTRLLSDLLLGVPSVIWGVVGYFVFSTNTGYGFHWGFSGLAAGLTLGFIMIPIVTRVTEQALRDVPRSYIEGALALGASRFQVVRGLAIPAAITGIGTGILLGVLNVLGQTAPLVFTNYYNTGIPRTLVGSNGSVGDLAMQIFIYIHEPSKALHVKAMAAALVLTVIVLLLDMGIRLLAWGSRKYAQRMG